MEKPYLPSSHIRACSQSVPARITTHPYTLRCPLPVPNQVTPLSSKPVSDFPLNILFGGLSRPIILINLVVHTIFLPLDPLQVFTSSVKVLRGCLCVCIILVYNNNCHNPTVRGKRQPSCLSINSILPYSVSQERAGHI